MTKTTPSLLNLYVIKSDNGDDDEINKEIRNKERKRASSVNRNGVVSEYTAANITINNMITQ